MPYSFVDVEGRAFQDEVHEIPAVLQCPRDAATVIKIDQSMILELKAWTDWFTPTRGATRASVLDANLDNMIENFFAFCETEATGVVM